MADHRLMDSIIVRRAGDSGDGVQLTASQSDATSIPEFEKSWYAPRKNSLKRTSKISNVLRSLITWAVT